MKLFFVCLYECNGIKLEAAYEKGTKTGIKQKFHKEKRELTNVQFLRRSPSS